MTSWGELYDRKVELSYVTELCLADESEAQFEHKCWGRPCPGSSGYKAAGAGEEIPKKNNISPKLKKALIGLAAAGLFTAGVLSSAFISKELGRRRDQAKGAIIKNQVKKAITPLEPAYNQMHQDEKHKSIAYTAGYLLGRAKKGRKAGTGGLDAVAKVAIEAKAVKEGRRIQAMPSREVGERLRTGRLLKSAAEVEEFASEIDPVTLMTVAQMQQAIKDIDTVIDEMEPPENVVAELRGFQAALNERLNSL